MLKSHASHYGGTTGFRNQFNFNQTNLYEVGKLTGARMEHFRVLRLSALLVFLSFTMIGCISLSTYQTPKIVEKGTGHVGVGMLAGFGNNNEVGLGEVSLIARYGAAERIDVGMKLSTMPVFVPYYNLYADVRYQLLTDPLYVSGSVGTSVFRVDDFYTLGFYPTVMAGTDRVYAGAKWVFVVSASESAQESFGANFPGAVVGTTIGGNNRINFMPEINLYFANDVIIFPGLSVNYNF